MAFSTTSLSFCHLELLMSTEKLQKVVQYIARVLQFSASSFVCLLKIAEVFIHKCT